MKRESEGRDVSWGGLIVSVAVRDALFAARVSVTHVWTMVLISMAWVVLCGLGGGDGREAEEGASSCG